MKLKPKKTIGSHPEWCGPSALSLLTGRSVNHCARVIAKIRNERGCWHRGRGTSKQVKGVDDWEMKRALHRMGFSMKSVKIALGYKKGHVLGFPTEAPTLRKYMAGRGGDEWKNAMLICVTGHYMVAHKDAVADNHHSETHYSKHPNRLKKVRAGWIVKPYPKGRRPL